MKVLISTSETSTDRTKIAALKKKKADIVAKCKADLAKLDLQLKALGHKSDMKLTYGKAKPKTATPSVPGRIETPKRPRVSKKNTKPFDRYGRRVGTPY